MIGGEGQHGAIAEMDVPVVRLAERQNLTGLRERRRTAIIFGYGSTSLVTNLHSLYRIYIDAVCLVDFSGGWSVG